MIPISKEALDEGFTVWDQALALVRNSDNDAALGLVARHVDESGRDVHAVRMLALLLAGTSHVAGTAFDAIAADNPAVLGQQVAAGILVRDGASSEDIAAIRMVNAFLNGDLAAFTGVVRAFHAEQGEGAAGLLLAALLVMARDARFTATAVSL